MQNKQIVVLGMHRSGASAVTGLLESFGVFVGEGDDLIAPQPENHCGFFERRDDFAICEALLSSIDCDWRKLGHFNLTRMPTPVLKEQGKLIAQLVQRLDSHGHWALKNPRLCLLLPLYKRFLQRCVAIFVLRHPAEVAASLRYCCPISRFEAVALWEMYTVHALLNTQDIPRIFVRYEELATDPVVVWGKLQKQLTALGVTNLKDADPRSFVDGNLRHQRSESIQEVYLTDEQTALWDSLCSESPPTETDALRVSEAAQQVIQDSDFRHQWYATKPSQRTASAAEVRAVMLSENACSHQDTHAAKDFKLASTVQQLEHEARKLAAVENHPAPGEGSSTQDTAEPATSGHLVRKDAVLVRAPWSWLRALSRVADVLLTSRRRENSNQLS